MKRSWRMTAVLLAVLGGTRFAAAQGEVVLVREGSSSHRIVLHPGASPSERHAAEELQSHLMACAGVRLPIQEGAPDGGVPMIVLGLGGIARGLGVDPSRESLGEQGFRIQTVSPHIVIAGTPEVGTLYGVHRFLERELGVRWIAPGVTKTPRVENLVLPPLGTTFRPAFRLRQTSYRWPGADGDFLARQGQNAGKGDAGGPNGIQYDTGGRSHSYFGYISPKEYFGTHPEYFSEIGGIRREADTQLCLTNPEVLEIVSRKMLERMRENPGQRQFNFSQMDYDNGCECMDCRAINEKYGTSGGTQFWFVNELAKRTSAVYPGKLVSTLAYTYTEEPPKGLKMHPNVAVWLCHMYPSCDSHPVATCPRNAEYRRRAAEWSRLCGHLFVWHYIVNFAHYYAPFPNFRALAADLRFYRDLGVEGLYLQGMGHRSGGGEFHLLRPYYAMKLAWDPDQDADGILHDFLQGYYGQAWESIRDYVVLLHDKVEKEDLHMHLYTNPAQGYLTDEVLDRAGALFDRAEAAVREDEELLERVRVARMPLTYARLFPRNGYRIAEGKLVFQGPLASPEEIAEFVARMKRHGFASTREHYGEDPELLRNLGALLSSPLEVVTLSNGSISADIVPALAGRILRIAEPGSGRHVTAHNTVRSLFFPFCGGYENRVGELYLWSGWMEPATVVARAPDSVRVALRTGDGFRILRTVSLVPGKPRLSVRSVLTNPGNRPRPARLRGHLELDLGELRKTRVSFRDLAGRRIDRDLGRAIAGQRRGEVFRVRDLPDGAWTFTGTRGLRLTHRFDREGIDFASLCAYPEDLGDLEVELWAKPGMLEPGRSVSLREEIELAPAGPGR